MRIGPFTFASDFWSSKTTWAAIGGVLSAVGAAMTGEVQWGVAALSAFGLLTGLFNRDHKAKVAEVDDAHRSTMLSLALNSKPKVDLEEALKAHVTANKASIAASVAATVAAVLDRYAAEYAAAEPRKPVVMNEGSPENPTTEFVPGGTGVDSGSGAANLATLDEPHDGEADA